MALKNKLLLKYTIVEMKLYPSPTIVTFPSLVTEYTFKKAGMYIIFFFNYVLTMVSKPISKIFAITLYRRQGRSSFVALQRR